MSSPSRRCLAPALGALVLIGCGSTPDRPDPTDVRLNDVDQRLGRVEHVVNNQSLLQLSQRLDAQDAQIRDLRGNIEELQNSNDLLKKQQRDLYADLDRKITSSQSGGAGAPAGSGAGSGDSGGAAATITDNDKSAYTKAFDALKSNDYPGAISKFKDFLHAYPQSSLGGNAEYWLGEAYYVTHDYDDAAAAFRAVGDQYPQSAKVPDAMLKLGLTQVDQKKLTDARNTLKQVVQRFPGTDAAKVATSRLQSIPPDQH
ncbi:MAG TPA: tol-pal system protein YbgF [Steroidobacteraceae bacterium]|jgi:tol-pal system protein YbgF